MIWLTWRQFRLQALAVYAAVVGFGVVLAVTGPHLVDLAKVEANVFDGLTRTDRNLYYAGIVVLALAPAVIGAFWGAPLVARELESGTHRLVWNQSVTRSRWLATKLGVTVLAAAAAVGALTWAVTWWSEPLDGAQSSTRGSLPSRLTPVAFAMRGVAPVGYAVFALVLGVTAGILVRRSLPAMAITLALFTFVQIAVPQWVRPHLIPPEQQSVVISRATLDGISGGPSGVRGLSVRAPHRGDWVLTNQTVDSTGAASPLPAWLPGCLPRPPAPSSSPAPVQVGSIEACLARLTREGYRQHVSYQPASRFWPLQWAETGLYLTVSALLAGFCFWWTRRRLT